MKHGLYSDKPFQEEIMPFKILICVIFSTIFNMIFSHYNKSSIITGEVFSLILFSTVFLRFQEIYKIVFYGAILSLLYIISYIDIKSYRIPNKLVFAIFIEGILFGLYQYFFAGDKNVFPNIAAGFFVGVFPMLLAVILSKGKMGAGDMKLMAALGVFSGPLNIFFIFVLAVVLAGFFAIIMITAKKMTLKSKLPLAPFISLAFLLNLILSEELIRFMTF